MKKREGDPFMPPDQFGKTLRGIMLNLMVRDMDKAVLFHQSVLKVNVIYSDPDITIVERDGQTWLIHADHTYDKHPLTPYMAQHSEKARGVGAEFRVHGLDPDEAEAAARLIGCEILDPTRDQPDHGLREVFIVDFEGYVWVPDMPLSD